MVKRVVRRVDERVVKKVDEKVVERVGLLQGQIREANCR